MRMHVRLAPAVLTLALAVGCDSPKAEIPSDPAKTAAASETAEPQAGEANKDLPSAAAKKADAVPDKASPNDKAAPEAAAVSCDALANKLVELYKPRGKKALFKKDEIPTLTKGCDTGKTNTNLKADVACIMRAADLSGLRGCAGADKVLKNIMENAP